MYNPKHTVGQMSNQPNITASSVLQTLKKNQTLSMLFVRFKHVLDQRLLNRHQLRELLFQLRRIQLVIASWGHYHFRLFFQREIHPLELRVYILLVHFENLIVTHHPGICKVPDSP
ncbi:hypothetical protein HanIR_Chr03g0124921 [Helianthus annuus]|nr:hypothetical protein HanIR_Chr03g0124921 [Helianthus annuus]